MEARLAGTVWEFFVPARVFYRACTDLGGWLGRYGISAEALTGSAVVFAALGGIAVGLGALGYGALAVTASGVCDMLDGAAARATQRASKAGALLDSTADRLADALPLAGAAVFYARDGALVGLPILAIVGSLMVSYVRARAEALGAVLPPMYARRPERLVLLVLGLLAGAVPLPVPVRAPLLLASIALLALVSAAGTLSALSVARQMLSGRR